MSYIILALVTGGPIEINNCETINTSFPSFLKIVKENFGIKYETK